LLVSCLGELAKQGLVRRVGGCGCHRDWGELVVDGRRVNVRRDEAGTE
jgi:hypothetical protein